MFARGCNVSGSTPASGQEHRPESRCVRCRPTKNLSLHRTRSQLRRPISVPGMNRGFVRNCDNLLRSLTIPNGSVRRFPCRHRRPDRHHAHRCSANRIPAGNLQSYRLPADECDGKSDTKRPIIYPSAHTARAATIGCPRITARASSTQVPTPHATRRTWLAASWLPSSEALIAAGVSAASIRPHNHARFVARELWSARPEYQAPIPANR